MFDVFDPSVTFANTLRAGGVFALIALHVGVLGYWSTRWLGFRAADFWSELCVRVGAGLAILGFGILAAGHLNGLHRAVAYASSAAMFVGLLASWGHLVGWTRVAASEIRGAFRENWFLVLACAGMAVLVVVCGLRAGWWVDEIEYHYAAPLLWAEHGKWVPSPYHNTNGPALAEVLFTFPALFKSDVAAHWMHSTCLLMLAAGCAGLSRRAGGSAIGALAAVLSVPVVVNQSHVAYSDIAAGGFAIAGYVALFCG
ncbi:MAG: hypothetical protein ACREIT_08050, partial [Tepidisphaeraceae bacterium]